MSTGVPARRSKLARHVADPTAISPVRVSIRMMDQVAEAVDPASADKPNAATTRMIGARIVPPTAPRPVTPQRPRSHIRYRGAAAHQHQSLCMLGDLAAK